MSLIALRRLVGGLLSTAAFAGCAMSGLAPAQSTYWLVPGMGPEHVRAVLGEPARVESASQGIVWTYQLQEPWSGPLRYYAVFDHQFHRLNGWFTDTDLRLRRAPAGPPGAQAARSEAPPAVAASVPATVEPEVTAERIFRVLSRGRHLDDHRKQMAAEVVATLMKASDRWPGAVVNQRPRHGWITVLLVDAEGLPEGDLFEGKAAALNRKTLKDNAVAVEDAATIVIDTALLKKIATATHLIESKTVASMIAAVVRIEAGGLSGYRDLWQENPQAGHPDRDAATRVTMLLRGTLALVISHELGHIALGRTEAITENWKPSSWSPRELDELQACPDLLDQDPRRRQELELRADQLAASLLGQHCRIGPRGDLRHQQYLLGANWYFLFAISSKMVAAARATESPEIRHMIAQETGEEAYQAAMRRGEQENRGAVHAFFPPAHPPDVERMRKLEAALAGSPCGGLGLGVSPAEEMLQSVIAAKCAQLKSRRSQP